MKGLASSGMGGILPMAMAGKFPTSGLLGMVTGGQKESNTGAGARANKADKMKAKNQRLKATIASGGY